MTNGSEVEVTHHVLVPFSIGKFSGEVYCDVVPMAACHLLLGTPWQFDLKAINDGETNTYSVAQGGEMFCFAPLSPLELRSEREKLANSYEEFEKEKQAEVSPQEKEELEWYKLEVLTLETSWSARPNHEDSRTWTAPNPPKLWHRAHLWLSFGQATFWSLGAWFKPLTRPDFKSPCKGIFGSLPLYLS